MVLADAARNVPGWQVTLHQSDGSLLPRGSAFQFSGAPSALTSAAGGACFARLRRTIGAQRTLELHNGIQHLGRSGARHEWDIALIPYEVAEAVRTGNQLYPLGLPILGIECKDKSRDGSSDEMRQTLARMYDLTHVSMDRHPWRKRIMDPNLTVGVGRRFTQYRAAYKNGLFGILRIGGFQRGARELSEYYNIKQFGHVTSNNFLTRFRLQNEMANILRSIDRYYEIHF